MISKVIVIIQRARKLFGDNAVIPGSGWSPEAIATSIVRHCEENKVQLELALAQAYLECHFGLNPAASRSRRTLNIYNVGNVDSGADKSFPSWDAGIKAYCELMRREYDWKEDEYITLESMLRHDFTRPKGGRYATAPSYTRQIKSLGLRFRGELGDPL